MALTSVDLLQIFAVLGIVTVMTPLLGSYMFKVFAGQKNWLIRLFRPVERITYACSGVQENHEMDWKEYTKSLLIFNLIGFVFLMALQMLQAGLPLNPEKFGNVSWHLAFNTAVSFVTNTNWQAYSGENTMSYLTQMLGLGVQNFVSAATGFAVMLAFARGFSRKQTTALGNFWVDLTRSTVHVLLPFSIVLAVVLVGQGVVQNFSSYSHAKTVEGVEQVIPQGPAASQIAIKQLGSNGGGFFGVNSAHPFENPTPLANFLEMVSLILLAAGCTYLFGLMVGSRRQGMVLFGTMMALMVVMLSLSLWSEYSLGTMEGKETRLGVVNTVIWSVFTTSASNGSVNGMISSMSPISGGIAMLNMMLGEVIFGGVGAGMYGMLLFVILTVFLCGLMVGRTPEYLGKKIEAREITWVIIGILAPCAAILIGSALSVALPAGLAGLGHQGPHGLSEILYAFTSGAGNNGSAFGSLTVNTPYYNVMIGLAMLIGRFFIIIPVMVVAGSFVQKKISPPSVGTFQTDSVLFAGLLAAVIIIVGALTFFPALSLGPILEHLMLVVK
ncbi:potassium-transporting ATPase subunit KdpA [Bdellovibrio svalbardensis]|uniref:Potassium-transporting ATPase potassium-binding subunit n=1 Tax=Bdellovibrio svalbardensis TaxID=2972972 RepID=A0ABT6DN43_9BACT|nr:potassium-transporting ATPase subunit KdpA [Bdellovibrio svalbardensis]MDG0818292.1 potassium-transporting ATPase subunit KdpA [Bdellovibrio svalbardensis]